MGFFPVPSNATAELLFEKSASYFHSEEAPRRAAALVPKARIIATLVDPSDRAYASYQVRRLQTEPSRCRGRGVQASGFNRKDLLVFTSAEGWIRVSSLPREN